MPPNFTVESLESRCLLAAPIVITTGGVYRGSWTSADANVAAVTVATAQPVVIENSSVAGPGHLIRVTASGANVTVRKVVGKSLTPPAGRAPGRFVVIDSSYSNLIVTKCSAHNTGGLDLYNGNRSGSFVSITYNWFDNIDGRIRNAAGTAWRSGNVEGTDWIIRQAVQIANAPSVRAEVAFNVITNEKDQSRVEDCINIYRSSGSAAAPIHIHDNYVNGAYRVNPTQAMPGGFSGGGIIADRGAAFVLIKNNTVINGTNYGIAAAGGHDIRIEGNRVLSTEILPDSNVGEYVWDAYRDGPSAFYNNTITGNFVSTLNRNNYWLPGAASATNNAALAPMPFIAGQWGLDGRDWWNFDMARAA